MTPLTTEQVAGLRMPDGFLLVLSPHDSWEDETWIAATKVLDDGRVFTRTRCREHRLANTAAAVANGHLPPEALDDVWRRVEGEPSREAELLMAVVQADNAVYATMAAMVLSHGDGPVVAKATEKRFDAATKALRESIETARKWIEEERKI